MKNKNVFHFSAIPNLGFSSVSYARSILHPDSCTNILFYKMTENNNWKENSITKNLKKHKKKGKINRRGKNYKLIESVAVKSNIFNRQ